MTHLDLFYENMTNVTKSFYREKLIITYFLIGIFLLVVLKISLNVLTGANILNIVFDLVLELIILGLVAMMVKYVWKYFRDEEQSREVIQHDLDETMKKALVYEKKSQDFVKQFQSYVHHEFIQWHLSQSEKEISLLILAGHSSKEMSQKRFTSERTIRNQCAAIYEKSKLGGKNNFCAYFLKEFLKDIEHA